jgi:hypothetical protein
MHHSHRGKRERASFFTIVAAAHRVAKLAASLGTPAHRYESIPVVPVPLEVDWFVFFSEQQIRWE